MEYIEAGKGSLAVSHKLVKFDWAVKKLLRSKTNFGILEGFLSELLRVDVKILEVLESESNKESVDDKFNRVDLLVKNHHDELIIIEVQVSTEYDYLSRMLYGAAKAITEHMKAGAPYKDVKKIYSVNVVYFDLGEGDDYLFVGRTTFLGMHSHHELKLNEKQKLLLKKETVGQIFPEFYLIKVNQFNNYAKNTLDEWIYFLKNEEIKEGFHARGLKEANEKLQILKLPPEEQAQYQRYLENLHYQASLIDSSYGIGRLEGEKVGLEEGEKLGLKKGEKIGVIKTATKMKESGISLEVIAEITGLSAEEIEKL